MHPLYDTMYYPLTTPKRGKVLMLLGLSKDGPVNVPIPIQSLAQAQSIFGTGSLYQAIERAYDVDTTITIYAMRIAGEYATCSIWGRQDIGEPLEEFIRFEAIYAGEKYNDIQVILKPTESGELGLFFQFPTDLGLQDMLYLLKDYENINALIQVINEDTWSGKNIIHARSSFREKPLSSIIPYIDVEVFEGGQDLDQLSKDDLYLALEYSYYLLEGYYVDYIIPIDARMDDTHPQAFYGSANYGMNTYIANRDYLSLQDTQNNNKFVTFHEQLIGFCKKQLSLGCMTHGILGLNIVEDVEDLERHEYSYIVRLLRTTGLEMRTGLAVFQGGNWTDNGYFISIVAGEQTYQEGTEQEYIENMAVTYAAMLASLRLNENVSNRPVPNAKPLRYQFTTNELQELSLLGIVAPRDSVRHGIVISHGVTAAMYNNEMHSFVNVRQVQLALSFLNEALEEYIGTPILSIIQSGTIEKVVEKVLSYLKEQRLLIDYRYNLEYDESKGFGTLSVDLKAINMIDFVPARARLSFAG